MNKLLNVFFTTGLAGDGFQLWIKEDTLTGLAQSDAAIVIPAVAAYIFAAIFYIGLIFVLYKLANALYNYFKTEDNIQERLKYKEDIKESVISTLMLMGFTVLAMSLGELLFPGQSQALKTFWSTLNKVLGILNLGSW